MGDIYRLLATGVETIAIIDGVFHQSTPVWQREILTALSEGIRVVGGASMGALRAAELAPHGMLGLGTVFEWYRDGVIDGDDEVALLHADAELAYRALSEPLVNLRYNLGRACVRGLISEIESADMLAELQDMYFAERTWSALRGGATWTHLPGARRQRLQSFVDAELEDIKRRDAIMVLELCAAPAPAAATPVAEG
jgi:hypothetical protein